MKKSFYIISYDLKDPVRDYSSLYSAIKEGRDWQHPLESVWVVFTQESADDLYGKLKPTMDNGDLLFVSRLDLSDHQGWLAKSFWDWINERR